MRARELGDVIALWYGEGDLVTPAFIRDAAKAALRRRPDLLHPQHARLWPAERGAVGLPDAAARPADPDRAHHRHAGRHAGALYGAGAAGRYRHQRRLCRAAMAQHPQRHPPDRRRAAAAARSISTATGGSTSTGCLRAATPARARSSCRRPPTRRGWTASREEMRALLDFSRAHRHLDHLGRGLRPALFRRRAWRRRSCRSPRMATGCSAVNSFSKAWAMTGWRIGWLTHPSASPTSSAR